MNIPQQLITTIFAFWAGFVSAISFMEAWLKFKAQGVTREIGLSIGKLVFSALNFVEIILLFIVWGLLLLQKNYNSFQITQQNILFWLVTIVLMLQTFWLKPALIERAEQIISGIQPPPSKEHLLYVLFEVVKVTTLIILALKHKHYLR